MTKRKLHRIVGILLTLPLLGWALTGIVFLTKPGYSAAYAPLPVRTYPIAEQFNLNLVAPWREAKLVKTVLGHHLLLQSERRRVHLDPVSGRNRGMPSSEDLKRLVEDAIRGNPQRYGTITQAIDGRVLTDTGIEISLDWQSLSLSQAGGDTRLIDMLYKVHYLQWSGIATADKWFGALGIVLLLALVALGLANLVPVRRTGQRSSE